MTTSRIIPLPETRVIHAGPPGPPGPPGVDGGLYIPTLSAAEGQLINTDMVIIGGYAVGTPVVPAYYTLQASEPAHELKFLAQGGRWFGITPDQDIDIRMAGAKCDGSDDLLPIQRAVDAANLMGGGTVRYDGLTAYTSGIISAKGKVIFDGGMSGTLRPLGNNTVLQLRVAGKIVGGKVDVSNIASYSGVAVLVHGRDQIIYGTGTSIDGLLIIQVPSDEFDPRLYTGTGLKLLSEDPDPLRHFIEFAYFKVETRGFDKGVHVHSTTHEADVGSRWINSNIFDLICSHSRTFCHFQGNDTRNNGLNGNKVNLQIQPRHNTGHEAVNRPDLAGLPQLAERALIYEGSFSEIDVQLWDWAASDNPEAIEFTENASRNQLITNASPHFVIDHGGTTGETLNIVIDRGQSRSPNFRTTPPPSVAFPYGAGNQDDLLGFAHLHWTITQTSGPAMDSGSLNDLFTFKRSSGPQWTMAGTAVVLEIDFAPEKIDHMVELSTFFLSDQVASSIKFELFQLGVYNEVFNITGNTSMFARWVDSEIINDVEKIRITLNAAVGEIIRLARLFAVGGVKPGYGILTREGGDVIDLTVTGAFEAESGVPEKPINETLSRDAELTDVGHIVRLSNASPIVFTIQNQATKGWTQGMKIRVEARGDGATTIVPGAGVTILSQMATGTQTIGRKHGTVWLSYMAGDTWLLDGPGLSGFVTALDKASSTDIWTAALDKNLTADNLSTSRALTSLIDGPTINVNMVLGRNFSLTLGGNRTLANPINTIAGSEGVIIVTQDGTGGRTLAYQSNWKFAGGVAPVITAAAGAVSVLRYFVQDSTHIMVLNFVADVK